MITTSSQRELVNSSYNSASPAVSPRDVFSLLSQARSAQPQWAAKPLTDRLRVIRQFRQQLAGLAGFTRETLVAQILPLCDAARYLETEAKTLLAPQRVSASGRPFWLRDVEIETYREPHDVVLIIAPANYPYFLPGVQMLQALAAGNTVVLKPGHGGLPAAKLLASLLPEGIVTVLDESSESAQAVIEAGVDKVVLTGSAETGVAVLKQLASHLTPTTLELSGDDPVFVLPDADLDLVVKAVTFGRQLNRGETCIAPRRIFAASGVELPWPVTHFNSEAEALELATSEYALGATVFGREPGASEFAKRVRAGVVVVNDMIVPTADPRLAFGGRGRSGFGKTRGAAGLMEMTVEKSVMTRRSKWRPHLLPARGDDVELFRAYIELAHGTQKVAAFGKFVKAVFRRKTS